MAETAACEAREATEMTQRGTRYPMLLATPIAFIKSMRY
jgi:hypothetical protein